MKPRDLLKAIAFSKPREYPFEIDTFLLPTDGEVQYARWLHPGETRKIITQGSVDALRSFLRDGDVAIDIGAHTGDSTLPIALAVGPRGRVFALEPNPYVFKVLAANAALNPAKTGHIVPLMFAAMPQNGVFDFDYTDSGYCNGGFHRAVSRWKHGQFSRLRIVGRDLAEYLRQHAPEALSKIRYIKVDTEGFDRAVVASMVGVLQIARPYVRTEIYKYLRGADRAAYFDDLRRLGYRVFKCGDEEYRGDELGRADFSRWRHFDVFAIPEEFA